MKKITIRYWIFTIIFALLMLFATVPDILCLPDAVTFMAHLGYPKYFVTFIGFAKLAGIVAILIPGFPRIKEWTYAGLAFDLIGAVYSAIAVGDASWKMLFMLIWFIPFVGSYIFYHKKLKMAQ